MYLFVMVVILPIDIDIDQLGNQRFVIRERAEKRLIAMLGQDDVVDRLYYRMENDSDIEIKRRIRLHIMPKVHFYPWWYDKYPWIITEQRQLTEEMKKYLKNEDFKAGDWKGYRDASEAWAWHLMKYGAGSSGVKRVMLQKTIEEVRWAYGDQARIVIYWGIINGVCRTLLETWAGSIDSESIPSTKAERR